MTRLSQKDLWSRIAKLNLGWILRKLCTPTAPNAWTSDRANAAVGWYRRFLYLAAKHPYARLVPSMEIDEVWHAHLMDSFRYVRDCQNVLGHTLHHVSENPFEENASSVEVISMRRLTHELFCGEFGASPFDAV